jgi:hypothetical protein
LNVSVLEHAAFASISASSFPIMPLCTGIHAITVFHSSFSSSHLSISLFMCFPIHCPDAGVMSYAVLTTAALSI